MDVDPLGRVLAAAAAPRPPLVCTILQHPIYWILYHININIPSSPMYLHPNNKGLDQLHNLQES